MHKRLKRNKILATACIAAILIFVCYFIRDDSIPSANFKGSYKVPLQRRNVSAKHEAKYFINLTNCQIPDFDPFDEQIMKFIDKEEYTNCSDLELLTYIDKSSGKVILKVNTSVISQYAFLDVRCCYSEIHRIENSDEKIRLTPCQMFKGSVEIHYPFIKVVCRNMFLRIIYQNVHATTLINNRENAKDSFSVLFVGIDSISKQTLQRIMPKTHNYLERHFLSLNGYNKIADNTFPNLMAILTGQDMPQLRKNCPFYGTANDNKSEDFLANCDFIWKHFKRNGYTTGYGEDACPLSTFNYGKTGFPYPPTDYYYRPYFLAAEQLPTRKSKCHNRFCSGPENTGERIFNSAKDFAITFKYMPSFGFFWTNSFSHDNPNCPSAMDDKVLQFLSDTSFVNSLNRTIFVFYSDHGYRFGDIRQTNSGWLEERLPFICLRIPEEFQRQFPKEYKNLVVNSRRLTTPYDLHNTLHRLLKLSNTTYVLLKSPACPRCLSLFEEIHENRTCEEAAIAQHWCLCTSYYNLPTTDPLVQNVAPFVVAKINRMIREFPEGHKCDAFSLGGIHSAGKSKTRLNEHKEKVNNVLIMIKTEPTAMFEVTVEVPVESPNNFTFVEGISRTDWYGDSSSCIENFELKKMCSCNGIR